MYKAIKPNGKNCFYFGGIHKLRHTLRGRRGRRSVTLCEKGGDLKFCDITFKKIVLSDIIRINQIETIPLKSNEH